MLVAVISGSFRFERSIGLYPRNRSGLRDSRVSQVSCPVQGDLASNFLKPLRRGALDLWTHHRKTTIGIPKTPSCSRTRSGDHHRRP